jgi:hypothetical protein
MNLHQNIGDKLSKAGLGNLALMGDYSISRHGDDAEIG